MAIIFALIMKMFISFHLPDDILMNPSPSENEITICAFGRLSVFEVCRGTDFLLDICKYLQTGAQAGTYFYDVTEIQISAGAVKGSQVPKMKFFSYISC